MLDPETADKIQFLRESDFKVMLEHIPRNQLEKKYGGDVEDLKTFWPLPYTFNEPPIPPPGVVVKKKAAPNPPNAGEPEKIAPVLDNQKSVTSPMPSPVPAVISVPPLSKETEAVNVKSAEEKIVKLDSVEPDPEEIPKNKPKEKEESEQPHHSGPPGPADIENEIMKTPLSEIRSPANSISAPFARGEGPDISKEEFLDAHDNSMSFHNNRVLQHQGTKSIVESDNLYEDAIAHNSKENFVSDTSLMRSRVHDVEYGHRIATINEEQKETEHVENKRSDGAGLELEEDEILAVKPFSPSGHQRISLEDKHVDTPGFCGFCRQKTAASANNDGHGEEQNKEESSSCVIFQISSIFIFAEVYVQVLVFTLQQPVCICIFLNLTIVFVGLFGRFTFSYSHHITASWFFSRSFIQYIYIYVCTYCLFHHVYHHS
eukprot:TRINITY_DN3372_c0_g1_i7.p1 TRINITY_DN3372_c0_g1~~TRINITY_DN3372_c0_g1_i7.p1  ORF type:complete len:431 (-),score=81.43 TRINITY_DN3372_c0_g1_i7:263-1555(-)